MKDRLIHLTYEIELCPGEKLTLPETTLDAIGPGRWLVTVRPAVPSSARTPVRGHRAFLNSYAPEDEGLYGVDSPG